MLQISSIEVNGAWLQYHTQPVDKSGAIYFFLFFKAAMFFQLYTTPLSHGGENEYNKTHKCPFKTHSNVTIVFIGQTVWSFLRHIRPLHITEL